MAPTMKDLGIDRFSVEDRLALMEEIWDSLASEVETRPITDGQRRELERRLADGIARPDAVIPWQEVKARTLARTRS